MELVQIIRIFKMLPVYPMIRGGLSESIVNWGMSPSMILAYLPALCYILNTSHLSHIISNNCNKFSAYKPVPTIIKLSRIRSNYVKSVSNGSTSGELPLWEDTPESVQKQIRAYGPDPPEDVFRKPVRPLGFWGRMMGM